MKTKRLIILMGCVLMVGIMPLKAQSFIGAMGGDIIGETGSVSYTVGQPADASCYDTALTINVKTALMIEGVQQPYLSWEVLDIPGVEALNAEVMIYPNPTIDGFAIKVSDANETLKYELYTVNGAIMQQGEMREYQRIDMKDYAVGSYMLRLSTLDNSKEQSYKIIKSH